MVLDVIGSPRPFFRKAKWVGDILVVTSWMHHWTKSASDCNGSAFCVILSLGCYICRLLCMWAQRRGGGKEEEAEFERIG